MPISPSCARPACGNKSLTRRRTETSLVRQVFGRKHRRFFGTVHARANPLGRRFSDRREARIGDKDVGALAINWLDAPRQALSNANCDGEYGVACRERASAHSLRYACGDYALPRNYLFRERTR